MKILQLKIKHFRNIDFLDLNLNPGINIFYGNNGQGKTNIVESVYTLAKTQSFRTHHPKEMIQYDQEEATIYCAFEKGKYLKSNTIILNKLGKICFLNQTKMKKLSEYLGELLVIDFTPEDVSLLKSSPKERRHLLDVELSALFPIYVKHLILFQKLLEQRNALLKQIKTFNGELLKVIDQQLLESSFVLFQRRKWFIAQIQDLATKIYQKLSGQSDQLTIEYKTFIDENNKESYIQKGEEIFLKNLEKDKEKTFTNAGVHKDDFVVYLNQKEAEFYASQGQQRGITLAIKLAIFEIITATTKEEPILILDDVFSELDNQKCLKLLQYIAKKNQVLITCTSIPSYFKQRENENVTLYQVSQGKVIERRMFNNG